MPGTMKVTVCQFHDEGEAIAADWKRLVTHASDESTELVLLPEMPFYSWLPSSPSFKAAEWAAAVEAHNQWETRLSELSPAVVVGTRPVDYGDERYSEGFVWTAAAGIRAVHAKANLQNVDGCWESVWYQPAPAADFVPIEVRGVVIGFLIGAELAATWEADQYRREHVQVLATPRSTLTRDYGHWVAAGRSAAIRTGAFDLSSNRAGAKAGGPGWIINPRGETLALTSEAQPFVSLSIQPLPWMAASLK
jgi:N-carbamoylputrescine amidase